MPFRLVAVVLMFGAATAFAAPVSCPDPGSAVRAGTCPSEEELQFTFNGYCSDNARIYGKGAEVCASYQAYRALKNVVLWESGDGTFQAYVSCDLPEARLRALRPTGISANREKGIDRLSCSYGEGVVFTRRNHETCRIESAAACTRLPSACKAECTPAK